FPEPPQSQAEDCYRYPPNTPKRRTETQPEAARESDPQWIEGTMAPAPIEPETPGAQPRERYPRVRTSLRVNRPWRGVPGRLPGGSGFLLATPQRKASSQERAHPNVSALCRAVRIANLCQRDRDRRHKDA